MSAATSTERHRAARSDGEQSRERLLHAGLRFPLGDRLQDDGEATLLRVRGTRNCDWWFSDEAMLLDTAGRYATDDPDADRVPD